MKSNRSKGRIVALIVSASLFVAGVILAVLGIAFMGTDSELISKNNYMSFTVDVSDEFKSINVDTTTCDVIFEPSADGSTWISAYIPEKSDLESYVEDGTLYIRVKDNRKWYDNIRISIGDDSPNVVVYMPKGEYGKLDVNVTTGDFRVGEEHSFTSLSFEASTGNAVIFSPVKDSLYAKVTTGIVTVGNTSPEFMEIKATTGDINIENVQNTEKINAHTSTGNIFISSAHTNELDVKTTTGDITLDDVISAEITHIESTSGDVRFTAFDSKAIYINVTTGDVTGELLSGKTFTTDTTTGDVSVPGNTEGGICNVNTTTGDIKITVVNPSARIYVWEKGGFGGQFTISLFDDGSFQYYEGMLSSYIGMGTWERDGDIITLTENNVGYGFVFKFKESYGDLLFIKDGSDKFLYTNVEDTDRFLGSTLKEN